MGKVRLLQSTLNAGELAPALHGRPEIPRYQNGLEFCRRFLPLVTGGATRMPGTRYCAPAAAAVVRLEPHSIVQGTDLVGYVLEFTNLKMRFYTGGNQILDGEAPYEVVTPFTAAEIPAVNYDSLDNVMYLVHGVHWPQRLIRADDTDWTLEDIPISAWPYMRPPQTEGITITPSATSGDITLTASEDFFVEGHEGIRFVVNGGIILVTEYVDATHVNATVEKAIEPAEGVSDKTNTTTITISRDHLPDNPPDNEYTVVVETVADFTASTMNTTVTPQHIPATLEVGESYGFDAATIAATNQLTGTEADEKWLEQAWSDLRGWPVSVAFHGQSMVMAGSATYPTTVWKSKIKSQDNDIHDFTIGTLDDEGCAFTPTQANTLIQQLATTDQIIMFSANRELTLSGGDKPITPTNFKIDVRTNHGSRRTVRPVQAGDDLLFVSRTGRRLRRFDYRLERDSYVASDLAIFADHLLASGGIAALAFAAEPWSAFFLITDDGRLLTLTHDTDQQVAAWAMHPSDDGIFRDVCVIPDGNGFAQVWFAVERTVNGQQVTYIEIMDDALNTDCAVTGSDENGLEEIDGYDHLEGKTVAAVADGYALKDLVVTGGKVPMPWAVKNWEIGLHYQSRLKDLPPGLSGASGTILGEQLSVHKIQVWLKDTLGCSINGEEVSFRSYDDTLFDQPIQPFTGMKEVPNLGWGNDGKAAQVEIVQDQPLPCTVLAIVKEVSING
jgi:hypothetical protein